MSSMVIAVASKKGGVGKSTLTQVIAQVLAKHGQKVTILDADPNKPQARWRSGDSKFKIEVQDNITESNIIKVINSIDEGYVLVDLEGVGSRLVARAIAKSDLVVIPIQASALDASEAGKTIGLIFEEEEVLERKIPFKVVLTRTNPAIRSKIEKKITDDLNEAEMPLLKNQLNERSAFKNIFSDQVTLYELDAGSVNGVDKAIANAEALVTELLAQES